MAQQNKLNALSLDQAELLEKALLAIPQNELSDDDIENTVYILSQLEGIKAYFKGN